MSGTVLERKYFRCPADSGLIPNLQKDTAISMNVESAWRAGYTGRGVLVAVVDDGVNMNHPDLDSNFVSSFINHYNFIAFIINYCHGNINSNLLILLGEGVSK